MELNTKTLNNLKLVLNEDFYKEIVQRKKEEQRKKINEYNKERYHKLYKEDRIKLEPIKCECGGKYKKPDIKKHLATKKHQKYLELHKN